MGHVIANCRCLDKRDPENPTKDSSVYSKANKSKPIFVAKKPIIGSDVVGCGVDKSSSSFVDKLDKGKSVDTDMVFLLDENMFAFLIPDSVEKERLMDDVRQNISFRVNPKDLIVADSLRK